jgi:hypothetical protein
VGVHAFLAVEYLANVVLYALDFITGFQARRAREHRVADTLQAEIPTPFNLMSFMSIICCHLAACGP